jgi:inorganic triphosphatase YgiF
MNGPSRRVWREPGLGAKFMAEGLETELKLAASPAMLLHLREHPTLAGKDRALTLVTHYFDTKDNALHRACATLRLRNGGARSEQTFKSAARSAGIRRGEWTAAAAGLVPDPQAFAAQPRKLLEQLLDGQALRPLALTRVERTTRRLRFGGSTIEVAFDFGTVEASRRTEPICELELELVSGGAADLFALALELPLGPELGWSVESKGERGQVLALKLPFEAERAREVAVSRDMKVGEGFKAIAWNCLAQLLGNYREVIATGDPAALHQSRVAIRRLRAAFSLFGNAVADAPGVTFVAEWKAAANGLGPARDLHVLIERVEAAAAEEGCDAEELLTLLRRRGASATRDAQDLLKGQGFQQLLIGFAEWLERGRFCDIEAAGRPLAEFAEHTLGRRRHKLVRGKPLDALPDKALHALRIKGKKLRYAAEFFATLYPAPGCTKARREFGKALARFQDCLGSAHDLAVAHEQRDHLVADLEPIAAARLSSQLAALLDRHGPTRKRLVRSAAKLLEQVDRAPAWWKAPTETESAAAD